MNFNKYICAWKEGAKANTVARSMNEDGLCLHAYGRTIESYHIYRQGEPLPSKGWKEVLITNNVVSKIMSLI